MAELGQTDQLDRTLVALTRAKESGALNTDLRGLRTVAAEKRGDVEEVWRLLPELLGGMRDPPPVAWQVFARVVGPISAPSVSASKSAEHGSSIAAEESTSPDAGGHFPDSPLMPSDSSAAPPPGPSLIDSSRVRNFGNLVLGLGGFPKATNHPAGKHLVTAYLVLGDTESALALTRAEIPESVTESYGDIALHILSQPPPPVPFPASTTAVTTPPVQLPAILSLLDEMARADVPWLHVCTESIWTLTERGDFPAVITLLSRLEALDSQGLEDARRSLLRLIVIHKAQFKEVVEVDGASPEGDVARCRRALVEAQNRLQKLRDDTPRSSTSSSHNGVDRQRRIATMGAFARAGDSEEAVRCFRELVDERPRTGVANELLETLCRNNAEAAIVAAFESMKASGPPPDIVTYRLVVGIYARRKQHDRVVELWNEGIARGIDRAKATREMGVNAALAMAELGESDQFNGLLGALMREKESGLLKGDLRGLQTIAAEKRGDVEEVWRLLPELLRGKHKVPPIAWKALARVVGPISTPRVSASISFEKERATAAEESTSHDAGGYPPDLPLTPTDTSAASAPIGGEAPSSIDSSRVRNFRNLVLRLGGFPKATKHPVGQYLVTSYIALGDTESALALTRAKIPETHSQTYVEIARYILSQPPPTALSPAPITALSTTTYASQLPAILSLLEEMAPADVSPEDVYAESIWTLTERGDFPALTALLSRLETLDGLVIDSTCRSLVNLIAPHQAEFDAFVKLHAASKEGEVARCRRALVEAVKRLKGL
ncbi:hypothetical protein BDK51DRAFT_33346 [Blyttiomyces helicus]|uniref:Pentacotripeptide-repeat region of PRORP domain-containing protein n=1 Tax=Blyttiomyces helicus TaxID=388810 RepID=A0A4P9WH79_9FUNG|nr:hypothetical protein BDK51DRAFT_33346 [Blyttiomyces helicus]|eukprot:RKO92181.1 hypothetical protein BDK51DRAFT_33346 [Blyttiomyces helicus]